MKKQLSFDRLEDRMLLATDLPPLSLAADGSDGFVVIGHLFNTIVNLHEAGDINGDGKDDFVINGDASLDGFSGGTANIIFGSGQVVTEPNNFGPNQISEAQEDFPTERIDGSTPLDGTNGFRMPGYGVRGRDALEISKLGDVNGDDIDDLALLGDQSRIDVVLGSRDPFDAIVDFANDPDLGFSVAVEDPLHVAGGDINGDGFGDIIFTTRFSTSVRVLFGSDSITDTNVEGLDGTNGFTFNTNQDDLFSYLSTGDVNKDGIDDVLISPFQGQTSFVLFGSPEPFDAEVNATDLNGQNGFTIVDGSLRELHWSPRELRGIGDVNDDGIGDIAIRGNPGYTQIMFGREDYAEVVETATFDSDDGFRITGFTQIFDWRSPTVAGPGDVNGDGIADILVANRFFPTGAFQPTIGETYVIFGGPSIETDVRNLTETTGAGFTGWGDPPGGDELGAQLSHLGDFNGDGINDMLIKPDFSFGDARGVILFGSRTQLAGDVDGNGEVDFNDFLALANNFGSDDEVTREDGDLDEDGTVSFLDFLILANNFGRTI